MFNINLNILECKFSSFNSAYPSAIDINLNILECEYHY